MQIFDLDNGQRPSRSLWSFAAIAALALHIGGAALALTNLRIDRGDDTLGAAGIEIALEVASPDVPDDNLPPGRDTEASQASPKLIEQKAEIRHTDLPNDERTEAVDPDRVVATSESKPTERDPQLTAVETPAHDETAAQQATSAQTLESVQNTDKAKSPTPGIGKDQGKLTADWGRKISAYFNLHKRYPEHASKSKRVRVKVSLVLNRRGNVVSVGVAESSGDAAFDQAALSMIRRSDPVPPPPAGLTEELFPFSLNVDFTRPK